MVAALSVSGLPSDEFMFLGFLPSKKNARRDKLSAAADFGSTLIFYEAPHRIEDSLEDIQDILGDREVCIAREITKIHEEFFFGKISDVRPQIKPLGEFVIVVGGASVPRPAPRLTREDVLKRLGISRNELYALFFKK
jgi:16S rRNA (cytidine1402-2'-O)-methyltransferase